MLSIVLFVQVENRNILCQKLAEIREHGRKRHLGNARFIGELYKVDMVSETIMHECMRRLLRSSMDEESLECFAVLFSVVGQSLEKKGINVSYAFVIGWLHCNEFPRLYRVVLIRT